MVKSLKEIKVLMNEYNISDQFVEKNIRKGLGSKVGIYCSEEQVINQEMLLKINKFGNALKKLGVEPENRILLAINDSPEFIYAFFRNSQNRSNINTC